jgi:hypothetical protein
MSRFLVATTGHSVPLPGGETYVGTDPAVQIPVRGDMGLMPRHFVIAPAAGGWHLAAFDGAMVLVNGLQVSQTEIHDGDQIVAGQLALTYRDEREAAMATAMPSLTQNSFPSLQTGLSRKVEEPEQAAVGLLPVAEPERAPPARILARTELGDVTSLAGGKRDHILMMLMGVVLIGIGGLLAKLAFFDSTGPLKQADLVIKEGQITGVSVSGRKASKTTELLTDLGLPCVIELPDDLHYNPVWSRQGSVAKIGFVKEAFDNKKLNMLGRQGTLTVATLEVGGIPYRSLAKYNTVQEGQNQMFALAGPGMVVGGLFLMMMGWEKWKTRRGGRG